MRLASAAALVRKYPFPSWVFALWDRFLFEWHSAAGTLFLKAFLSAHRCKTGIRLTCDGIPLVRIQMPGSLEIGDNVTIRVRPGSNLAGISQRAIFQTLAEGRITIGDGCGLSGTVLSSRNRIVLGQRVNLGVNVRIYDHDFHSLNPAHRVDGHTDRANISSAPIMLSDDVFVGANALILKGVEIRARSIVAAGSVVTRGHYPENCLLAGNPARIVAGR